MDGKTIMAEKKEELIFGAYFDAQGNKVTADDSNAVSGEELVKLPNGETLRRYLTKPQNNQRVDGE